MKEQPQESYVEKKLQEQVRPISFRSSFWIVLAIHLFGGVGFISLTGGTKTANAEDKKFLESKEAQFAGIEKPTPTPTPTPTPLPVVQEKISAVRSDWPKGKPELKAKPKPVDSKFTQTYTIKKGDTLYGICKKYKLNFERLKEINNIKDPSKLVVGQKLKFM
jgi:LysM repeat protein